MSPLLSLNKASVMLGKTQAISDVSLDVRAGEVVALLGANGAGKTSFLRAALGFAPLNGGTASLGGDEPRKLAPRARALRAAFLPQKPQAIWPVRVEDLAALGRYAHGGAPAKLGRRDQAAVDAALNLCSLSALRTRRMDEISGGERMRAHLARALAQGAPLLLLDEPTAGLDPAQSLGVSDILRAHAKSGGAVVFSTHDLALAARAADRVLLMCRGRVIAQGAPVDALTQAAIEAAYGRRGRIERIGEGFAALFE
jgi:iron complex transport system ATP-binding protein